MLFHGNPAEIDLVAVDPNDPEHAWHVREFGGGVLVVDPKVSGRTFIPRDQLAEYEDFGICFACSGVVGEKSR